ncbi:MAG: hypothetical protein HQL53_09625, partial [Magnetococcales bacterium]|nr:hypothetical protein [Magnetococcales bacterium]
MFEHKFQCASCEQPLSFTEDQLGSVACPTCETGYLLLEEDDVVMVQHQGPDAEGIDVLYRAEARHDTPAREEGHGLRQFSDSLFERLDSYISKYRTAKEESSSTSKISSELIEELKALK